MTDSYVTNDGDYVDDGSESQTTSAKHMLTKVRISNFKRIKEAELEIGPSLTLSEATIQERVLQSKPFTPL